MKKPLTILYTLMVLSVLFLNCRKENGEDCPTTAAYQALMPSAKEWFPYTSNRILVFETSTLVRDTLELKNYFLADDSIWNGDKCPQTKGEFLRGNIIDKKSIDTIKVQIGFGEQVQFVKGKSYLIYYDTRKLLLQPSTYRRFESSIALNGKTFTSVLVFECSPDDKCVSTGITKFYFSKTKGLVAYTRNNILYTLR